MSQAEALLNSLAGTVIDHKHEVPDSDTHFIIDPFTRQIENTNYQKTVIMRGDHNSERFTFEVPRYVDGHDMSLCNRVIVHFDNVGDSIENIHSDIAYMDDLRIDPDNPDAVISSWLIRREATQIVGILSFSLQYQCIENEEVTYEWNTDSYDEIEVRKSKQNGEAAIIQYTNVLEQWRSQIFGAGDSVMTNITTEGANQVAAVQNESATQQAAIELKGSETLATIPEDYTEVYNMAEEALRTKADGVVCEAEGSTIAIADASNDYIRGLNVFGRSTQFTTTGKNLLPIHAKTRTSGGITYTVYDDGHIHVEGTATSHSWLWVGPQSMDDARLAHIPAGIYFLSGTPDNNATGYINGWYADGTAIPQHNDTGSGKRVTLEQDVYIYYQIMVANGTVINSDFYPQLEVGETATAFEPYTGGMASPNPDYPQEIASIENPVIEVHGKNLLDADKLVGGTFVKENGVYTFTKLANSATSATYTLDLPAGDYVLSWGEIERTAESYRIYINYADGSNQLTGLTNLGSNNLKISTPVGIRDIRLSLASNVTTDTYVKFAWWQLESGTEATDYEPFVQPQSIALANTLHGIPVTSGGNYTDENGQQWICDEVDLERGVYVQRIYKYVVTGAEPWTTSLQQPSTDGHTRFDCGIRGEPAPLINDALCTHAPWGGNTNPKTGIAAWVNNPGVDMLQIRFLTWQSTVEELTEYFAAQYEAGMPVTYHYILATPIETPLTAEEIETYKTLKTNYPNTTVLNDSSAWMKVKYNADTKLYIDNTSVNDVVNAVEEVLNDSY